jgi:hypothetical protein
MQERYIEYQLFPEDYFSGCDISVYFGDIWVDEIVSLTFSLVEQVQPIYSYNSKTYNDVARGNRIIQGTFRINFREARYLTSILKKCIERQEEIKTFTSSPKDRVSALVSLARSGEILINTREFLDEYNRLSPEEQIDVSRQMQEIEYSGSRGSIGEESLLKDNYYFQGGKNSGFDIVIVYGRPPEVNDYDLTPIVKQFPNSFHKISGVQISNVTTVINPDGQPVFEDYQFIAKDLN